MKKCYKKKNTNKNSYCKGKYTHRIFRETKGKYTIRP